MTHLTIQRRSEQSTSPLIEGVRRISTTESIKTLSNQSFSSRSYIDSVPGAGLTFEASVLEGYEKVAKGLLNKMREDQVELTLEQIWLAAVLENTPLDEVKYRELNSDIKSVVASAANMLERWDLIEKLNSINQVAENEIIRPMIINPDMDLVTARNVISKAIKKWNLKEGDFSETDEPTDISVIEGARFLGEVIESLNLQKVKVIDIQALKKNNLTAIEVEVSVGRSYEMVTKEVSLFTKLPSLNGEMRKMNETEIRELIALGFVSNFEVYNSRNFVVTQTCIYIVQTHPTHFALGPHPLENFFSLKKLVAADVPFDRILSETYLKYYSEERVKSLESREERWISRLSNSYLYGRKLKVEFK